MSQNGAAVRQLFREELLQLQSWFLGIPGDALSELFPADYRIVPADFYGAKLVDAQPLGDKYYDFPPTGREYRLADQFMEDWARHCRLMKVSDDHCRVMIHLFLLHEFYHILQSLTSDRYQDSDHAPRGLQAVDYLADAHAIRAAYRLYERYSHWPALGLATASWNHRLAALIQAAMRSMEVFNADHPGYPLKSMRQGERFVRYSMWHFQHARAQNFLPEAGDPDAFGLTDMPLIEFEQGTGFPTDNMTLADALPRKTKLFVTWRGRIYRYTSDGEDFARNLRDGVFHADCSRSYEAFRELLQEHSDFTGRGGRAAPATAPARLLFDEPLDAALNSVAAAAKAANVQVRTSHVLQAVLAAGDGVAAKLFAEIGDATIIDDNRALVAKLEKEESMKGFRQTVWTDRDDVRKALILAAHANSPCIRSRHLLLSLLLSRSGTNTQLRNRLGPDKFKQLIAVVRDWPDVPATPATPGG